MLRWGGRGGHVLYINKITEHLIFHIQGELQYVRHNGGETSALCPLKVIGVCMCVCVCLLPGIAVLMRTVSFLFFNDFNVCLFWRCLPGRH